MSGRLISHLIGALKVQPRYPPNRRSLPGRPNTTEKTTVASRKLCLFTGPNAAVRDAPAAIVWAWRVVETSDRKWREDGVVDGVDGKFHCESNGVVQSVVARSVQKLLTIKCPIMIIMKIIDFRLNRELFSRPV